MNIQYFRVYLQSSLILSESTATAGAHHTRTHIPTQVLRGLLASRLYAGYPESDVDTWLHDGRLQWLPALPARECEGADTLGLALPMPLALHVNKMMPTSELLHQDRLLTDQGQVFQPTTDLVTGSDEHSNRPLQAPVQPRQLRAGYLTAWGHWVRPRVEHHTRTAIDPATGRAAEGQLFHYEALSAGQSFVFGLRSEDDTLLQRCRKDLQGKARLGRSRSAEFGAVEIEPVAAPQMPRCVPVEGELTRLWLLDELALRDALGQPSLRPDPVSLTLPDHVEWDSDQSFLRPRRLSAYNQYLRAYLPDAPALQAGTVLALRGDTGLEPGLHWLRGCPVLVSPFCLAGSRIRFEVMPEARVSPASSGSVPSVSSRLLNHLRGRYDARQEQGQSRWAGDKLLAGYRQLCRQACLYLGLPEGEDPGLPSTTQLGELRQLAREHTGLAACVDKWSEISTRSNAEREGEGRSGWGLRCSPQQTLQAAFEARLRRLQNEDNLDDQQALEAIQQFVVQARNTAPTGAPETAGGTE